MTLNWKIDLIKWAEQIKQRESQRWKWWYKEQKDIYFILFMCLTVQLTWFSFILCFKNFTFCFSTEEGVDVGWEQDDGDAGPHLQVSLDTCKGLFCAEHFISSAWKCSFIYSSYLNPNLIKYIVVAQGMRVFCLCHRRRWHFGERRILLLVGDKFYWLQNRAAQTDELLGRGDA